MIDHYLCQPSMLPLAENTGEHTTQIMVYMIGMLQKQAHFM